MPIQDRYQDMGGQPGEIEASPLTSYYRQVVSLGGEATTDQFNRFRVSNPETLMDSKQTLDNQPLFWDDAETSGGGTSTAHSADLAASTISVSNVTAGTRVRQTFQRYNYQPGKSQLILMTGVLGAGAAGITRRIGYFDDNNGLYFELDGTTLNVVRRTNTSGSPVNTAVAQADWNMDKMDGTGPSGITLDTSLTQIMIIDFEWLGVGAVRFGWVVNGAIIYCHKMLHSNVLSTVYMSTPNLPLRYEISNDGTGPAADLVHICTTVSSEGGSQEIGILGYASTGGVHVDANAADSLYAIVGIRLASAQVEANIDIVSLSTLAETNDDYEWQLVLNPTVAGTFTYSAITNYAIERALGATANTVSGGTVLTGGWGASNSSQPALVPNSRRLGADISGTVDTLVLCARPLSANADIQGSITFRQW